MSERRTREILTFCAVASIVALAAASLGLAWGDDRQVRWQLAARYTARAAFPLFLAVFVAGPWQRLAPGPAPRWLVAHRRALGLAFATMFTVHLIALATFSLVRGQGPDAVTLVVGGGAFVALYALALTSNDAAVRRLGAPRWRRLHASGLYYLWFVYTFTYVGRLGREPDFFALFALACVVALVVRIAGRRRRAVAPVAAAA
jgi:DMSO/TMAO reductase YedYZ heme-binding membrane subunit